MRILIVLLCLIPIASFSQTHDLSADVNGGWVTGNNTIVRVGSTVNYGYNKGSFEFLNRLNGSYASQNGQIAAKDWYYWVNPRISYKRFNFFIHSEFLQNYIRKIDFRVGPGLGAEYILKSTEKTKITSSLALIYEKTSYSENIIEKSKGAEVSYSTLEISRISYRFKYRKKGENVSVSTELWFQPSLPDLDKIKAFSTLQFNFNLHKNLSLLVKSEANYEELNVTGVKSLDIRSSLGISYDLQR